MDQRSYFTACNLRSGRRAPQQNKALTKQLADVLEQRGFQFWPGVGIDSSGQWPPETSFLVLGLDRENARSLGEEFEQNAIVVGRRGEVAELLIVFEPDQSE